MAQKKSEMAKLRSQATKVSNKLAEKIIEKMVSSNVGIVTFPRGYTDTIYTFMGEQEYLMHVGAVVIPKTFNGERWVGVIDEEDILYNDHFSFLRGEITKPLEWFDEQIDTDLNTAGANIEWLNRLFCVDDESLFPIDTYYQISETLEEVLD